MFKFEKKSNVWAVLGDPNFGTRKHGIYTTNVSVSESSVSGEIPICICNVVFRSFQGVF